MEPQYVEEGNEFGDFDFGTSRPKWMSPTTDLQRRILAANRRKYWPVKAQGGQEIRYRFIMIERAMIPLSSGQESEYPTEWVDHCVRWYEKVNKRGNVPLKGLLTFLQDEDRKNEWVAGWKRERKPDNYAVDPYA